MKYSNHLVLYKCLIMSIVGVFFLASCESYSCVDYKTGTFRYESNEFDAVITRTESQQIEVSDSLNYRDVFQVIWTSDCYYKLVLESTNNPARMPLSKFDTIFVKIGEVDKKGYYFEAEVLDQKPNGRIVKIKDKK